MTRRNYENDLYFEAAYTGLTAATSVVLNLINTGSIGGDNKVGNGRINLADVDWTTFEISHTVSAITGSTSATPTAAVKGVVFLEAGRVSATTSDRNAVHGDGSTVVSTAALAAPGANAIAVARQASTGASASNVLRNLGLVVTIANTPTGAGASGIVRVYFKGR